MKGSDNDDGQVIEWKSSGAAGDIISLGVS